MQKEDKIGNYLQLEHKGLVHALAVAEARIEPTLRFDVTPAIMMGGRHSSLA